MAEKKEKQKDPTERPAKSYFMYWLFGSRVYTMNSDDKRRMVLIPGRVTSEGKR